ncbi:hypothetical protein NMY22_g10476 [Coprinellus aureogranulatus]|nr:hypothetical protein NMY22_g10476 [Coprinellus aureogranulatus]
MKFTALAVLASLTLGVHAHFRLLFPEPRGQFVADQEPNFCGGYNDAVANRTTFPLEGGFFRIRQGHENWANSVLLAVGQNPNSFDAFKSGGQDLFLRYWANETKTGNFCIPLDFSSQNISGVEDGANVTIQIVVNGGDGQLYQCADLTLRENFTFSSDIQSTCVNQTADSAAHGSETATAPGSSATGGNGNGQLGGFEHMPLVGALGVGLVGALAAIAL